MIGNSYSKCSDQEEPDDDLSRLATWSADHGLVVSKTKCFEFPLHSKKNSCQLRLAFLNGEALSRKHAVKCPGVYFSSNTTWSTHINIVFFS